MSQDQAVIEQWGRFELALSGLAVGNPFLETVFSVRFSDGVKVTEVDGFYDGDGVYKARFMPERQGPWTYQTVSNRPELHGITGTFTCGAPAAGNHGPVRVVDAYHFGYADGTPYHPVGTTCYVWNLQGDELERQTLETLKHAPFNKLRCCVFPKRYPFNLNEPPCYPFPGDMREYKAPTFSLGPNPEPPPDYWDFSRFNPAYFQHLEQRVGDLQALGIEADLILFHPYDSNAWGFDRMPATVNERYLRYLVARLAAYRNVWWSFANEYELLFDHTMADWDAHFQLVQQADPYGHPRSIHNIKDFYDHRKPWVTHCSVQHSDTTRAVEWQRQYGKPVVIDECGYEGNIHMSWGDLSPQEMVQRFWQGFADGCYVGHGETYLNPEEVLWWSKGGTLRGESVARIAFLREVIEGVPGAGLVPLSPVRFAAMNTMEDFKAAVMTPNESDAIIAGFGVSLLAAGHSGTDYYLFYFGPHQPSFQEYGLPAGSYRIDVLDTWNMTVTGFADSASGKVRVTLPTKPYQAIRIERNHYPPCSRSATTAAF